jgi:hypothetical protein
MSHSREAVAVEPNYGALKSSRTDWRHKSGCSYETMCDFVHGDAKTLQSPHAEQRHVARFGKDHFVIGLVSFGGEDGVTDLALNLPLRGGGKNPLSARCNPNSLQNVRRKPGALGRRSANTPLTG